MPQIRTFALAILTLVWLVGPAAAFASTKCLCNNGAVTESIDDDADCDDACDMFGGGRTWTPADAADDDEDTDVVDDETVRDRPKERQIERR